MTAVRGVLAVDLAAYADDGTLGDRACAYAHRQLGGDHVWQRVVRLEMGTATFIDLRLLHFLGEWLEPAAMVQVVGECADLVDRVVDAFHGNWP